MRIITFNFQQIMKIILLSIILPVAEVNKREYRAWYGLGQTYEILRMSSYALYYYKIAQELQPYDSRMLIALGDTYEKLEQYGYAIKCYQRAYNAGDIEGITLQRMGNLFEKLNDVDSAIPIYIEFCKDERLVPDKASLCRAYITLGNYYMRLGQYDEASHYAYKCLEYNDLKREAQEILETIKEKRLYAKNFPDENEQKDSILPVPPARGITPVDSDEEIPAVPARPGASSPGHSQHVRAAYRRMREASREIHELLRREPPPLEPFVMPIIPIMPMMPPEEDEGVLSNGSSTEEP